MAVLNGWALNSWYGIDHTYVSSSVGHVWNCWGRHSGGNVICSGEGDSDYADCISQTKSHAGLIYGITGVCHQTANRILFPAGCIVSAAKNYWITAFIYGTYGITTSSNFTLKIKSYSSITGKAAPFSRAEGNDNTPEQLYLARIYSLYNNTTELSRNQNLLPGHELRITIDYRLGSAIGDNVRELLLQHQAELLRAKKSIDQALLLQRLSPEKYATKINDLSRNILKNINVTIGVINFEQLFGLPPDADFAVIDPEIVFNVFRKQI